MVCTDSVELKDKFIQPSERPLWRIPREDKTVDEQTLEEWLLWAHARIRIAGQDHKSVLEMLFEKWMPHIERDGQTITCVD